MEGIDGVAHPGLWSGDAERCTYDGEEVLHSGVTLPASFNLGF
jgi:hypothetical protein